MIIGYGDNNVLLIGLVESDLGNLRRGGTETFEGQQVLVKDIIIVWAEDKEQLLSLLKEGGVSITEVMADKYRRGERTDTPRKPS